MFHTEKSFTRHSIPPTSVFIVGVGGLLALLLWTLPTWNEFWSHLAAFPALWQIPANQAILIVLVLKISAPVWVMLCLGSGLVLYQRTQPYKEESAQAPRAVSPQRMAAPATVPPFLATTLQWTGEASALPFPMGQPRTPTGQTMPPAPARSRAAVEAPPLEAIVHQKDAEPAPILDLAEMRLQPEAEPSNETHEEVFLVPDLFLEQAQATEAEPASLLHTLQCQMHEDAPWVPDCSELDTRATSASVTDAPHTTMQEVPSLAHPVTAVPEPPAPEPVSASTRPLLSLRLLKEVSLTLCVPGGREVVIPLTSHAKRLQLLAYIGWRRGEMIDREKVLEQVFGWGLSDEEATEDKLTERFESHKKLLRRKIREVATGVNVAAGMLLLDPDIDPFVFDTGFWGLSGRCRVEDLSVIEAHHTVIAQARKEGRLVEVVPDDVKDACDRLIEQYPGDFLETMISKHAGEFRPFQGRSSWARKPFTLFRDYYLDALWYAAEYHMQHGQHCLSEHTEEEGPVSQNTQQAHYARAAQGYQTYALYACNSRFDAKVTINVHGDYGERIGMSERALRRCVVLLGLLGKTDDVNQVWSAYLAQMRTTFDQRWTPSKETVADVESARAQTNAYRFPAQIAQLSSAFAQRRALEEGRS